MFERGEENNWVCVTGVIVSDFSYSHEVMGERFYLADLSVARLSGRNDIIPLLISGQLIGDEDTYRGRIAEATGQFRSYSRHEGLRSRLLLSVFTRQIRFLTEPPDATKSNQIYLEGFVCKQPVFRKTPMGREICDLFLAVNRPYGKSDYIPCIAWGRNSRIASTCKVSDRVRIWGRIQSREYSKKIGEDQIIRRTAFEVSIHRLDCL